MAGEDDRRNGKSGRKSGDYDARFGDNDRAAGAEQFERRVFDIFGVAVGLRLSVDVHN